MGFQTHSGVPDRSGVPVIWWDTRHRWGTRQEWWGTRQVVVHQMQVTVYQMHVMVYQMQVAFQTWDDGVPDREPGRGRITALTSHQSEILHSLIFLNYIHQ